MSIIMTVCMTVILAITVMNLSVMTVVVMTVLVVTTIVMTVRMIMITGVSVSMPATIAFIGTGFWFKRCLYGLGV